MAILKNVFKDKKDDKAERKQSSDRSQKQAVAVVSLPAKDVLVHPHITEKASLLAEQNAYTFEVTESANKTEVAKAVKAIYKVTPKKVRIVYSPGKRVFVRGNWGVKQGAKKAIVYLKKGDTIEFI
jgi:large subunit ribosomal protein L23